MAEELSKISLSKYRGCLMGALIGDCVGNPLTGFYPVDILGHLETIRRTSSRAYLTYLWSWLLTLKDRLTTSRSIKTGIQGYTDDTALTWALAESLIKCKGYSANDMAWRFKQTFFTNENRGYGLHVRHVFHKWKEGVSDVYQPAKEQFSGKGSYGNGSAMRIAPVPLYYGYDYEKMLEVAKESSLLTHSHPVGYNGALLQCLAIWLALKQDPQRPLDAYRYIDDLIAVMCELEQKGDNRDLHDIDSSQTFTNQLKVMKDILPRDDITTFDVIQNFGHGISAGKSVSTAIYSFVKANKQMEDFPVENPFERTVAFAIHFGGDADTIGAMAGSIAGAYYGIETIPSYLQKCCEDSQHALKLADELHLLSTSKDDSSFQCL